MGNLVTRSRRRRALRVAMFPRGIDGLFLLPGGGVELLALVQRGSPEEDWAHRALGPGRLLPYTLHRSDLGPYPATEELLAHSDIPAVLAEGGAAALFLGASCTPTTFAWGRRHGVRLLMTDFRDQRRFEDKIWFDGFMRCHGIPRPAGGPVVLERASDFPLEGPAVVQAPDSMGGEGTYFVRGRDDVGRLLGTGALASGQRYLVRERIEGRPYGITVFVAPGGVALSAVRLQCYHPTRADGRVVRDFAGVQWVPARELGEALRRRIDETFPRLGELLHGRGFFGFANIDFMVDGEDRIFVLECNPRMSAATPQLLRYPELVSGVPAGAVFLQGTLGRSRRASPRALERAWLPQTSYCGATLDVVHAPEQIDGPGLVRREFPNGLYRLGVDGLSFLGPDVRRLSGPDEVALFSFARAGQRCRRGDTLASIVSNLALYGQSGELLAPARQILDHLRYIDDR